MSFRRSMLCALPLTALACQITPDLADTPPPASNVIVIMTDDQGWGDFGFRGNAAVQTPHLDAMASRSAQLANFYVSPVCTPTRAALMTGRSPQRTRAFDTYVGRAMMDPEELTLAEILGEAGWSTGIFGKWHLGDCYPMRPMDQGFDESLVHRGGGIGQPSDPEGGERHYTDPVLFHNGERVECQGYCTDVYFDAAADWIGKQVQGKQPFFAYIATNAPHGPFHDVPQELYQEYVEADLSPAAFPLSPGHSLPAKNDEDRLARIFAMITNIDQNVGRLFKELERLGQLENTMVVFLCDNGPNTRRWVGGMRGMKSHVHEGGVRSPILMHWPSRLKPGVASDRVACHMDLLPTVLDACEVDIPAGLELDGRSLMPLLDRREDPWRDRTVTIQAHRGDEGVRYHHFFIRNQRWKLLNASGFGRAVGSIEPKFELYDMQEDPLEEVDVAATHPEVVERLRQAYDAWFDDVSSTRPNNYAPPAIVLGSPRAKNVALTRQDWRTLGGSGWGGAKNQGHWALRVVGPGPYRIRVRFLNKSVVKSAQLFVGDQSWSLEVPAGATECTFESVSLALGEAFLRVDLTQESGAIGPYQVLVSPAE